MKIQRTRGRKKSREARMEEKEEEGEKKQEEGGRGVREVMCFSLNLVPMVTPLIEPTT